MVEMILASAILIGLIGTVIALLLNFAGDRFYVEPNKKAEQIRALLPGNNCGGCGYAGCDALAEAIAAEQAPPDGCPMCTNTEKIGALCGVDAVSQEKRIAYVACGGDCSCTTQIGQYRGVMDCLAAKAVQQNGGKGCRYGCMGFGSCVKACPFGALSIHNGIAAVNPHICTGCGQCTSVCPNHLISLQPAKKQIRLTCSSPDKGLAVKQVCTAGCLGCGLCSKKCPQGAISMDQALPVIHLDVCTDCGTCAGACPTGAIRQLVVK